MDDNHHDLLFPEATGILLEAIERHKRVLPFALEAIDLAHIASQRQRDYAARIVPGIPKKTRVRNDINDDAWRYFRSIADPLVEAGDIREFVTIDGGDVAIMPDGLPVRLKKGDASGETSNYPTRHIRTIGRASERIMFSEATPLDVAILEGMMVDVVFVAGLALGEYTHVGLRFSVAEASPFIVLDPASPRQLMRISPEAFNLVADTRAKLAS